MPRLPRRSGAASRASRRRLIPAQGRHPGPSVPRLPRKTTVDVRLCHACHVKSRWMSPSATPATQKWRSVTGVTAAPKPVQARHPGPSVPRLPRKTTVDVRLCHACHVKSRWMSPSATPATQKWRGVTGVTAAPKPVQARHPVPSVPRRMPQSVCVCVGVMCCVCVLLCVVVVCVCVCVCVKLLYVKLV